MTIVGLNTGLIKLGTQGLVFSVQGNVFKIVEYTSQGIENNWTVPIGMKMQGGGSVTVPNAMPFGGKIVRMVIFREIPNVTPNMNATYTIMKNGVAQSMTLTFTGGASNNTTQTIDEEVLFDQGDLIGIRFTGSSTIQAESRITVGILYAFNIGQTTP